MGSCGGAVRGAEWHANMIAGRPVEDKHALVDLIAASKRYEYGDGVLGGLSKPIDSGGHREIDIVSGTAKRLGVPRDPGRLGPVHKRRDLRRVQSAVDGTNGAGVALTSGKHARHQSVHIPSVSEAVRVVFAIAGSAMNRERGIASGGGGGAGASANTYDRI